MVWGLASSAFGTLPRITIEDVLAYDALNDTQRAAYIASNTEKATAIAIYLAFEQALVKAAHSGKEIGVDTVLNLALDSALFDGVMTDLSTNLPAAMVEKMEAAYTVVYAQVAIEAENTLETQINGMLGGMGAPAVNLTVTV